MKRRIHYETRERVPRWCDAVVVALLEEGALEVSTPARRNGRWSALVHWPALWGRAGSRRVDLAQVGLEMSVLPVTFDDLSPSTTWGYEATHPI